VESYKQYTRTRAFNFALSAFRSIPSMTWRRATYYWACFLVLGVYYVAAKREPATVVHTTRAAFLDIPESEIQSIEVRRGDAVVRCRRINGRWKVEEPSGGAVPSDLVAGLISNLTELPDVEVVAESPRDLTQFGLDASASQLILTPMTGPPITLRLGRPNPSGTAVYAQRSTSNSVFLVGLNVSYYEDLLFDGARRNDN
jgi:hypothetical protein